MLLLTVVRRKWLGFNSFGRLAQKGVLKCSTAAKTALLSLQLAERRRLRPKNLIVLRYLSLNALRSPEHHKIIGNVNRQS